ncbi:methyltransferase domain-containing protein [Neisseria chenwenguii]|uniref:Methyltransferase n=1 Tax=Neisseria chenwenguii TaxID=1853278 RepID=A0A220S5B3_9NEIS|nr:methyltransferase domain-containing protein [Neisseria chenwenguii]ASK28478.1 methyltransferase [Neisseria chenwenguii]ROV57070.1 methyltransferase domain-containing protein [Neisseria chenwenguii]
MTDRWQIHRLLAEETDQRLQLLRTPPQSVLLVGADADISRRLLAVRFPQAAFAEYDPRADFLQAAAKVRGGGLWQKLTRKTVPQTCQSLTAPLPEAAADMLWANLSLPAAGRLPEVFQNWARALKPDGLLFFTHFGRDTLEGLKGRLKNLGIACETPTLIDMHDLGDMLADNGFYDPVTDTAKLELTYRRAEMFWQDMATLGLENALRFSDPAAARDAVSALFADEGGLTVTLETVYGHAVKKRVLPQGENLVRFYPRG